MQALKILPEPAPADAAPLPDVWARPQPPADDAPPVEPGFHSNPWAWARAIGGFSALGLATAVSGPVEVAAASPAGLVTAVGVLLLTAPALVVGHQYLGMKAAPAALLGALVDAFARAGAIALGAAPAVLWLGVMSDLAPLAGRLALVGAGSFGLLRAMGGLVDAERRAGGSALALATAWGGLAAIVALRLLFVF